MDPKAAAHLMSAFPTFAKEGDVALSEGGLTMRDYFAAKAMQGMMVDVNSPNFRVIAQMAFEMADAMLEAREA